MAAALVSEGLYQREAQAMVNTWRDSWFEEDGLRVLYTLPREWTDRTLRSRWILNLAKLSASWLAALRCLLPHRKEIVQRLGDGPER